MLYGSFFISMLFCYFRFKKIGFVVYYTKQINVKTKIPLSGREERLWWVAGPGVETGVA